LSHSEFTYKPRILFISHSGDLYGAERSLLTMVTGMKALDKYEILVFIPESGALADAFDREDVPFLILPYERWIGLRFHAVAKYHRRLRNRLLIGRLVREAKRWMPDIVYTNTIATPVGAMLAERLSPKPLHIWHARELPGDRSTGFGLFDLGTDASLRLISRTSDCIICNSRFLHDRLVPGLRNFPVPTGEFRSEIVYNGLDIEKADVHLPVQVAEKKGAPLRLVMAGGISAVKNYDEAIEAVGILAGAGVSVLLEIYGSGNTGDILGLGKRIEKAGLEKHVQLMGYKSRLADAFSSADMLLVTSRMETFGRTAVEAMLAGCPVISSDAGALPEIVRDGETGLVYCSGDPGHLVRQIKKLDGDPELRRKLTRQALEYARTRFSAERFVSDIDRILLDLLSGRNLGRAHDET
jgi:glycosyltransferase involved in cell wall biosynthesis